ncbi:28S ribosomal protein S33, mitochondrial [Galendromus occidentalis]|uniref:Small ribosomal subunit protein mS33 n=1 Tax=Galendromus occidentalis TaxID=34638 RepID=A0AAJ6VYS4_9ACAR|nr:28S ribosomal protein S33, mitochondrial [Galendromus occidentalis]
MSAYARRMALLSARIFGEPYAASVAGGNSQVVRRFAEKPMDLKKEWIEYYPPLFQYNRLMLKLRAHGLFRDEHLDFQEEMKRLRKLRGKGPPKKGQGKRASLKK